MSTFDGATNQPHGMQLTSSNGPSFIQQGSFDWVGLGRMQFSASVAVLGRLASAGIDTLTVAFGQAMCTKIPIGVHGEKKVQDAMKQLKAFSSYGDLIWFGVGVRHVLRDLVQTSQGSSLVALGGALSEGYSQETSALILYELAKLCGAPLDLQPSFSQWTSVMHVTSSIFNSSTFGLQIGQLSRLADLPTEESSIPSHPRELAQVILAIGMVSSGSLEQVRVQGGTSCSWVAVWSDFVLGLRVQVISATGATISTNFNNTTHEAQVVVSFTNQLASINSIQSVGKTMIINSGIDFIRECFAHQEYVGLDVFSGGRVKWETMFQDIFGQDFLELVIPMDQLEFNDPKALQFTETSTNSKFQAFFAIGLVLIYQNNVLLMHRYEHVRSYLLEITTRMPELWSNKDGFLQEIDKLDSKSGSDLRSAYDLAAKSLQKNCNCNICSSYQDQHSAFEHRPKEYHRAYCILMLSRTIHLLSVLLGGLILDIGLNPRPSAIEQFYKKQSRWGGQERFTEFWNFNMTILPHFYDIGNRFHALLPLFSLADQTISPQPNSAISNGKIYCYIGALQGISDAIEDVSLIHLGSGSIQYGSRIYSLVSDKARQPLGYSARQVKVASGVSSFFQDTTSPGLTLDAIVAQNLDALSFSWRFTLQTKSTLLSPVDYIRKLEKALKYKTFGLNNTQNSERGLSLLEGDHTIIEGEGVFDFAGISIGTLTLRPLRNNTFGRCIAISNSQGHAMTILIRNDRDFEVFDEVWNRENVENSSFKKPYILIS